MNGLLKLFEQHREVELSGEELGSRLGVTRSAVWKGVESLRKAGHIIRSTPARGYCYSGENDRLSREGVEAYLQSQWGEIVVMHEVSSTNTLLKQRAEEGAAAGTVLIAEQQNAGRGRRGRSFLSPRGGIYMSVLLRPDMTADRCAFITALTALATAEALDRFTLDEIGIKWVNDLYVKGKKICGILTEGSVEIGSNQLAYMVIGIGINIRGEVPDEIAEIATTLSTDAPRVQLCAAVLDSLAHALGEDFGEIAARYRARSLALGRNVTVLANPAYEAKCVDIDDEAHLIVESARGRETLLSGEISIRLGGGN